MNSLVIPVVLWGNKAPSHNIQCITVTQDFQCVVTGCRDGQLCVWEWQQNVLQPKLMLFGHACGVTSVCAVETSDDKKQLVSSVSGNGEIYLWDISDGRCIEQTKLDGSPIAIKFYKILNGNVKEPCLICYGQFAEIFILNATSLQVLVSLVARIYPDWISSASVLQFDNCTAVIGLTMAGTIKVWQIPTGSYFPSYPILEDESKQLRCSNVINFSYSNYSANLLLVVCRYEWQLYDAGDFSLLCTVPSCGSNTFQGGDFTSSSILLLWDSEGIVYLYTIPFSAFNKESYRNQSLNKNNTPTMLYNFSMMQNVQLSLPPVMKVVSANEKRLLLSGNSNGTVTVWSLNHKGQYNESDIINNIEVLSCYSISNLWDDLYQKPAGIIDNLNHNNERLTITSSLYLEIWGIIACGREDGSIVLVPIAKACKVHLLQESRKASLPHKTLRGHEMRVTCLLYPHQDASRYSPQIFISGSIDFSVILWDLTSGTQMHEFHVHGGEITQLLVPPMQCSPRILHSFCSVASDNSVALLSIKERKCVMLAACHPSPVVTIKWKPLEDFMLVACNDGSLYVWQMETGHLDRHITGIAVSDILADCDNEKADFIVQNTSNLSQAFKQRNFAAFKAAAQQGLKNIIENIDNKSSDENAEESGAAVVSKYNTMLVQPIRASPCHDADSHVIFFNAETLIGNLLQDHALMKKKKKQLRSATKNNNPNAAKKVFTAIISQVRNQLLDFSDPNLSSSPDMPRRTQTPAKSHRRGDKTINTIDLDTPMDVAQVLLSCLHGWGLDARLDELCTEKLGIFTPINPVCFGLLSREGHICLMLPSWSKVKRIEWSPTLQTIGDLPCHVYKPIQKSIVVQNGSSFSKHTKHWEISNSLTTQHLIGVIAVANTMMELSNAGFLSKKKLPENTEATSGDVSESSNCTPGELAQAKQGWSLLATLHCVLLPDLIDLDKYKPPKLELLARRWQDRCLEIREAAQALLLAKLRQIEVDGRRLVVQEWIQHMPDYIEQPQPSQQQSSGNDSNVDTMSDRIKSPYRPSNRDVTQTIHSSTPDDNNSTNSELVAEPTPITQKTIRLSYETRRRQAIAIIILGVMGAEFGQETTSNQSTPDSPDSDGFGLINYPFARQTCRSLVYLLLQPPTARLPAHAPIRRAAIDLLGRGFVVWEPYIDASAVLLGLLELCIDYDTHIASIHSGLPLSAEADSCRSAHHALCLIATARPLTFITTIAREVARHNAAAANPQHQALLATSVLARAKREVLQIIELLADKMMNEISDLLMEVVDIILFCLDNGSLRSNQTLYDAYPVLAKFHTVSFDTKSKRLAIGTKQGHIIMHDLRSNKNTSISRGRSRITALAFSPEGKYLAVYSMGDNQLSLWMASTSLFGILQSQIKCVKTVHPLPPAIKQKITDKSPTSYESGKDGIRLVWVSNRVIVLLLSDGSEYRCHV